MTRIRRPRTGLATGLVALCAAALILTLLVVWLPGRAAAAIGGPEDGATICWDDDTIIELEHERTVVIADEVTDTEQLFVKQVKTHHGWVDYDGGSVTRWESPTFSDEGWIGGVRYRYRPVEGETRTVVVEPAVAERQVEWFATTPPDGWTPTGQSRVTAIEVEVPCLPDEPPACACLPVVDVPCDQDPECRPPTLPADPCSVWPEECIDHGPEPEADHTDPAPDQVEVGLIATERPPTLPRTGIDPWDGLLAGGFALFLGAVVLYCGRHDRRHANR